MRAYLFIFMLFFISPALAATDVYICPMHPHISGVEGDSCPICGMSLVPKIEDTPTDQGSNTYNTDIPKDALKISPTYVHALGIKTTEVTHKTFGRNIRAFGKIAPSTRLQRNIDVRTKGWVVALAKDAVGDTIEKGELLFTYYSPELMQAQSDFLVGRNANRAEQRLRQYGMDKKAIAKLRKKGDFLEETPFYAPADGTITTLNVRKGAHVNEGGNIMMLQDYSTLWVNIDVPIRDVQFLALKTATTITVPETGETYETMIDFIHPVTDQKSRTVMVRLLLDNPDGNLKPGTYIDAIFKAEPKNRLAIPMESILYSSRGAYVMESLGDGYFQPIMVETGVTSTGLTEITNGLSHGQNIVTSGQFMLDAESNLRGGMAAMGHDHDAMETKQKAEEQEANHEQH